MAFPILALEHPFTGAPDLHPLQLLHPAILASDETSGARGDLPDDTLCPSVQARII
jgi:hypothetical protein